MALEDFLSPGERIVASCPVRHGTLYVTDRRLCFLGMSSKGNAFRDLALLEISAVALEPMSFTDLRAWGITVLVVGVLVTLIFAGLDVMAGWVLGLVVTGTGGVLIGSYSLTKRVYLVFSGTPLLAEPRLAERWRFIPTDMEQTKTVLQRVRDKLQ